MSGFAVTGTSTDATGTATPLVAEFEEFAAERGEVFETTPGREVLTRAYDAELAVGDGRTLDIRVVPYGVEAIVADPPSHVPYRERFLRGAFERQLSAADRVRVWLNFEHEQGIRGVIGHGVELAEADDGLHGSFRVHANADGDKTLQLVGEGMLGGVSAEFVALRSRRIEGVVERVRAHLDKVSLCRNPAYAGAAVLAVRELPAGEEAAGFEREHVARPSEAVVPALDEALAGRLSAHGIEPLARIATTSAAWDGSPSRFSDEEYRRSALLCRGTDAPPKTDCSLPVLEPSGALNTNALGAAAAALAGGRGGLANVSGAQRAAAARRLIRYYSAARMEPPASVVSLARS
jgi:HK97 family phage prohead protease